MSLTKPVNSKSNIKQFTDADLPFSPRQPVIARFTSESTLNQTVVSLPFQVDTVNAADSFFLIVDGKTLTPGALNDYQFTSVDAFGYSSSVTLNYSLAAGLNIQAVKLGLKKETEFLQDARFTQLYNGMSAGFQTFIDQPQMNATTIAGAPVSGAGTFYSTIPNRSPMIDLSRDVKVRMGSERIPVQKIMQITKEYGPNGEIVYTSPSDLFGQIRLVGAWNNVNNVNGNYVQASGTAPYVEVTFYGTTLNMLTYGDATARTYNYSVDGGSTILVSSPSYASISGGRQYAHNLATPIVTGLTLGIHTVRIWLATGSNINIYGFDIGQTAGTLQINPGTSYVAGKTATLAASTTPAYNSGFESGTLGTRGGRVIVYQKTDGTIAKAVTPANASSATLASSDHTNEEVVRNIFPGEFGVGRTDDLATANTSSANRAFTLDDGSTTFTGFNIKMAAGTTSGRYGFGTAGGTSNYMTIQFVGTGLDIVVSNDFGGSSTRAMSVSVDGGASVGNVSLTEPTRPVVQKIVSGLPYGTHTVKFQNVNAGLDTPYIHQFMVYQPKTPAIPAGAALISSYNIVANYIANNSNTYGTVAQGVIRKAASREFAYITGSWSFGSIDINSITGWNINTTANADAFRFRFYGTGFELRMVGNTGFSNTGTISVDGSTNLSGFTTGFYGTFASWTPATGTFVSNTSGGYGNGIYVSGLTLGWHDLLITKTAGSGSFNPEALDIITPIHAPVTNQYSNQNAFTVGSTSVGDERHTTPLKENNFEKGIWNVIGNSTLGTLATTSSVFVPVPDMFAMVNCRTGKLRISACMSLQNGYGTIAIDGQPVYGQAVGHYESNGTYTESIAIEVTPGVHRVEIMWKTSATANSYIDGLSNRSLNIEEI